MLYHLHVGQMLTSHGGICLVHGNTSEPWPLSVRISGGTGHSDMSKSEASQKAEKITREWLTNSSLESFELWSGVESIRLFQQLQIEYGKFHNIHDVESTRHRYSFSPNENTRTWMLSPLTVPMCSAVSKFREHICVDRCWVCLAMEEDADLETVISYLDDVRNEDWHDRMSDSTPWSKLDCDRCYSLLI